MSPGIESGIVVEGVSRSFGSGDERVEALRDVSFVAPPGSVTAMLGVNGAGKTTLAKILATLLLPTSGRAAIGGHDVVEQAKECRRVTSVVFGGDRGFYMALSGRRNLAYFSMLAGLNRREVKERLDSILDQVGLAEAANRRVETYSKGMLQRLHIAAGLISRPAVLLLDEPTVGLDPTEAQRLREAVAQARDEGVAVLLTSHLLLDVELLADRVLLLDGGVIREDLALRDFVKLAGYTAVVTAKGRGEAPRSFAAEPNAQLHNQEGRWVLSLKIDKWSPGLLASIAKQLGDSEVEDLKVDPVRLDDVFSSLTGGDT